MITRLVRHEVLSFFRTPLAAIFTVAMPVLMMVIVGAAVGNQTVDPATGVRVMQFVVPVMTVFGVAQGCFGALTLHLADLRDRGWLKRLRGTPVPAWAVLAGLAGSVLVISVITVVLLLGVGLVFYDLQIVWRTLPALLVTLLLGALTFTALGFGVVALVRSSAAVQLLGTGLLLALAFISDVILVGGKLPAWLDTVGWIFPLRHMANAVRDCFNPYLTGAGWSADHLAVLAAWGAGGAAVALWRFRWERRPGRQAAVRVSRRRGVGRSVLLDQTAHALTGLRREPATVFFTVALPVLLFALVSLIFQGAIVNGVDLPVFMLAAMITYTVGAACYLNLAEALAGDREKGVRKRLAGTPLPRWAYYGGRLAGALLVTAATAVVLGVVAGLGYGVTVTFGALPGLTAAIAIGAACFASLGVLVGELASKQQVANAVALGTFLPLAFVSDVFVIGGPLPGVLQSVGDVFPIKHVSHALLSALTGGPWPWADLAVVAAWTAVAVIVLRWRRSHA
ncbi:ABC transporter permease [Nonomuraea soli]|uniref:Transport permease protein n=1 Tax=Nonomuraea soli TaxID=1032476 RepID=A0A7W0CFF9_9ACTN|nr:ABC transporter permease [Nonomuraea soli]MBA2890024.1 ABC-type multidrug transport system permease subunit [Nonomuraea soli]